MALTEQQQKWFASIKANLEAETGRSFAEWVELARQCPETRHRARLAWMKETYGFGMNRASVLIGEAFPSELSWHDDAALLGRLWSDPASRAVFDAVYTLARELPGLVVGARKTFTGFSRKVQFAAIRPLKGGGALLGLDMPPDADPRLGPMRRESWSERLKSAVTLSSVDEVDAGLAGLLRQAWDKAG